ncbi:hypothetical protein ABW21_db0201746 [Orbilia brochopaga]|nr:hypothetical protein ABW21_db0201746 [Drechslerella brochopaga]
MPSNAYAPARWRSLVQTIIPLFALFSAISAERVTLNLLNESGDNGAPRVLQLCRPEYNRFGQIKRRIYAINPAETTCRSFGGSEAWYLEQISAPFDVEIRTGTKFQLRAPGDGGGGEYMTENTADYDRQSYFQLSQQSNGPMDRWVRTELVLLRPDPPFGELPEVIDQLNPIQPGDLLTPVSPNSAKTIFVDSNPPDQEVTSAANPNAPTEYFFGSTQFPSDIDAAPSRSKVRIQIGLTLDAPTPPPRQSRFEESKVDETVMLTGTRTQGQSDPRVSPVIDPSAPRPSPGAPRGRQKLDISAFPELWPVIVVNSRGPRARWGRNIDSTIDDPLYDDIWDPQIPHPAMVDSFRNRRVVVRPNNYDITGIGDDEEYIEDTRPVRPSIADRMRNRDMANPFRSRRQPTEYQFPAPDSDEEERDIMRGLATRYSIEQALDSPDFLRPVRGAINNAPAGQFITDDVSELSVHAGDTDDLTTYFSEQSDRGLDDDFMELEVEGAAGGDTVGDTVTGTFTLEEETRDQLG